MVAWEKDNISGPLCKQENCKNLAKSEEQLSPKNVGWPTDSRLLVIAQLPEISPPDGGLLTNKGQQLYQQWLADSRLSFIQRAILHSYQNVSADKKQKCQILLITVCLSQGGQQKWACSEAKMSLNLSSFNVNFVFLILGTNWSVSGLSCVLRMSSSLCCCAAAE